MQTNNKGVVWFELSGVYRWQIIKSNPCCDKSGAYLGGGFGGLGPPGSPKGRQKERKKERERKREGRKEEKIGKEGNKKGKREERGSKKDKRKKES